MLVAPRILKAPATWRFSHFSQRPRRWPSTEAGKSGVRRTTGAMRSAARRISSSGTSDVQDQVSGHVLSRSDAVMSDLNDRLVSDLIDSVKQVLRKEAAERLREVYLVGDIDKDSARSVIERLRELANENSRPITLYLNTRRRQRHRRPGDPRRRSAELVARGVDVNDRRAGDGVFDGLGRAAGGEPGAAASPSRTRGS